MEFENRGKLETTNQKTGHLNILVLDKSEQEQTDNYEVFYSGNDKIRRYRIALMLRQIVVQAARDYNAKSNQKYPSDFGGNLST